MGELKESLFAEWERLNEENPDGATLWDAVISLLKDKTDIYLLILKADIDILKMASEGHSAKDIARSMGVSTKEISKALYTWGLQTPLSETLDFNPLLIYNDGMVAEELQFEANEFMPFDINLYEAETIIGNVEKYLDLVRFLKEQE